MVWMRVSYGALAEQGVELNGSGAVVSEVGTLSARRMLT
jgi:hypothetical protein